MPAEIPPADNEFWKRKLLALLHDPPDKCFDLARHEESARTFAVGAGFVDAQSLAALADALKPADHFAAAADRFVFPRGTCATRYTGEAGASFLHPLASSPYEAASSEDLAAKAGHLHEVLKDAVGGIGTEDWHTRFFLYWRRWLENTVTTDKAGAQLLAFSPADSRLPDHTIWNHMAVTAAAAACLEGKEVRPAMLLFQLGPVQEFIAQARSTRDLWSGSYLLSWLMGHAMKAVADRIGPDAILFPSLRGNGIFDALHRETMYATLWDDGRGRKASTWERLLEEKRAGQPRSEIEGDGAARWLLTPTLPNRFLALAPAAQAVDLARDAEAAVRRELAAIAEAVWNWVEAEAREGAKRPGVENWKPRWDTQIAAFPQIAWAVQPWLDRDACLAEFTKLPVNTPGLTDPGVPAPATPLERLQDMLDLAERWLPVQDRDPRYYADANERDPSTGKTRLKNPGALWAAHYALADARLAARRNTRDFDAWTDPTPAEMGTPKDSLSGKEESIGDEEFWEYLAETYRKIFTGAGHRYGTMNLLKRLWCRTDKVPYLSDRLGLEQKAMGQALRFDTVQAVACMNRAGIEGKDEQGDDRPGNPYVAVLAMDGDEIGKWVSGEKTPEFLRQVSRNAAAYLRPILARHGKEGIRRLLTPSYHLQFSEALANYATWLVEPIVQACDGQLVYAGGDDVLAMLPGDRAIPCAEALRAVFRGQAPAEPSRYPLAVQQEGYVTERAGYPLIVPGPAADVSVGLAIGHFHAPLQMLVREAQNAERRAKNVYGRGALAVSLYKRSGETIEWGCRWDAAAAPHGPGAHGPRVALELLREVTALSPRAQTGSSGNDLSPLSGRFAYALAALLEPYRLDGEPSIPRESLRDLIRAEFAHVVKQQGARLEPDQRARILDLGGLWLDQCAAANRLEDFAKLFLVETFIHRQRGED
ncbi:MAG: type III-B CRISPR-associated protein Cas10/Cmr2 [Lentisphaeria bacterium]|nr:type III-B CRISPR-associated protein Cas10/Cmr2 [Lentisphaeria bacterium]